jgi:hypothetical protein
MEIVAASSTLRASVSPATAGRGWLKLLRYLRAPVSTVELRTSVNVWDNSCHRQNHTPPTYV